MTAVGSIVTERAAQSLHHLLQVRKYIVHSKLLQKYALFNATKYVCHWDTNFAAFLAKKRAEGKHYNVAISHAAKKLVRLIFAMEKSGTPYHLTV